MPNKEIQCFFLNFLWKKKSKIFLLRTARKNKLFLQYAIRKSMYFLNCPRIFKNWSLIFYVLCNNFFSIWLTFVFDLQKVFYYVHNNDDAFFFFFSKILTSFTRVLFNFCFFFFRKILISLCGPFWIFSLFLLVSVSASKINFTI